MRWPLMIATAILLLAPALRAADEPAPEAADPHAQLQKILQRPSYQAWRLRQEGNLSQDPYQISPGMREWLKRPFKAIGRFLDWLFSSHRKPNVAAASAASALPTVLKWVAILVLAIALGFAVVLVIRMIGNSDAGDAPAAHILSRQQVLAALQSGDALSLPTDQWLDEARRQAAEQNFRAVYRALYLALLSGLHQAGKIQHNRNRTNWVYVRQYRGSDEERVVFSELTDLFDRVWYGHRAPAEGSGLDQVQRKVALLTGTGGLL